MVAPEDNLLNAVPDLVSPLGQLGEGWNITQDLGPIQKLFKPDDVKKGN